MLDQALALAREAVGLASPNPTVGCLLTRDGTILGTGAHHYDALDHAEITALKQAATKGHNARGATAYVTLEPCSFYGRTGPCADALVHAGIARCVIATVDPNPKVSGAGIAKLRAAGVEVVVAKTTSSIAQQARRLNDAFAFSIQYGRPFVTLKAALSVDGMLAPPNRDRRTAQPVWITGPETRADVQLLRHSNDAILTGSGTVRMDNPLLTDRTGLPRRRPLLRVVLDSALTTGPNSRMLQTISDDLIFFVLGLAPAERCNRIRAKGAEVIATPQLESGWMDLKSVLRSLHEKQIRSVLLEGGSGINKNFLAAGLVDQVVFYFSETELGKDAIPFATGTSPYVLQERLTAISREWFINATTTDVKVSGYLHDPWSNIP